MIFSFPVKKRNNNNNTRISKLKQINKYVVDEHTELDLSLLNKTTTKTKTE